MNKVFQVAGKFVVGLIPISMLLAAVYTLGNVVALFTEVHQHWWPRLVYGAMAALMFLMTCLIAYAIYVIGDWMINKIYHTRLW